MFVQQTTLEKRDGVSPHRKGHYKSFRFLSLGLPSYKPAHWLYRCPLTLSMLPCEICGSNNCTFKMRTHCLLLLLRATPSFLYDQEFRVVKSKTLHSSWQTCGVLWLSRGKSESKTLFSTPSTEWGSQHYVSKRSELITPTLHTLTEYRKGRNISQLFLWGRNFPDTKTGQRHARKLQANIPYEYGCKNAQ